MSTDRIEVLALKWGEAVVGDALPDGGLVTYHEVWRHGSIEIPGGPVRLLAQHDRRTIVGRLDWFETTGEGLYARGVLAGSQVHREHTRELIAERLLHEASISFRAGPDDQWLPAPPGGLPTCIRSGARVREVSLTPAGAIPGSRVLDVIPAAPPAARPATGPRRDGLSDESRDLLERVEQQARGGVGGRLAAQRRHIEATLNASTLATLDVVVSEGDRTRAEAAIRSADEALAEGRAEIERRRRAAADRPHRALDDADLARRMEWIMAEVRGPALPPVELSREFVGLKAERAHRRASGTWTLR